MNCDFAEKISMLIDGELSAEEIERMQAHLDGCEDCRKLEKDFLFLSRQIKEPSADFANERFLPVKGSRKNPTPIWRKRIFLPLPAFGLIVLILLGFAGWSLFARFAGNAPKIAENQNQNLPKQKAASANEYSLARFDTGARAEIYVAPRGENEK